MNERFKQMAEEVFFDESTNGPGQKMYMFGELKMQKFAELIIQECLKIVNRKEYSYYEADPLWETAELIKEHFGVK